MTESAAPLLRLEHALARDGDAVATVLLVACLIASTVVLTGMVTPASSYSPLAEPPEEPTERLVHVTALQQDVAVEVTEDSEAYTAGDRLENQGTYPISGATDPTVTATAAAEDAGVRSVGIAVVYEAAPSGSPTEPFWTDTVVLTSETYDGTAEASLETTVDVESIAERRAALREEFGPEATVSASVVSTATYGYESADGERFEETLTVGGPLTLGESLYQLPHESTRQTPTTGGESPAAASSGSLLNVVFALFGATAGIGAVGAAVAWLFVDPGRTLRELERRRYEDWVTAVESFTPQGNITTVTVSSLGDLVDLAIDTRHRVIYHKPVDEYFVIADDIMYIYAPNREAGEPSATANFGMEIPQADVPPPNFDPPSEPTPDGGSTPDKDESGDEGSDERTDERADETGFNFGG
jgi:hypothetical protein